MTTVLDFTVKRTKDSKLVIQVTFFDKIAPNYVKLRYLMRSVTPGLKLVGLGEPLGTIAPNTHQVFWIVKFDFALSCRETEEALRQTQWKFRAAQREKKRASLEARLKKWGENRERRVAAKGAARLKKPLSEATLKRKERAEYFRRLFKQGDPS